MVCRLNVNEFCSKFYKELIFFTWNFSLHNSNFQKSRPKTEIGRLKRDTENFSQRLEAEIFRSFLGPSTTFPNEAPLVTSKCILKCLQRLE